MKEPIEQFILLNKSSFDDLEPGDGSWDAIRSRLKKPEKLSTILLKIAAVVTIGVALGVVIYTSDGEDTRSQVVNQEFLEQEIQYVKVIQTQKKTLKQLDIETRNNDLLLEETELEKMYLDLKAQYLENPQNDQLKESLLQNLRMRGLILMEQIELLKSLNPVNDGQETSTS